MTGPVATAASSFHPDSDPDALAAMQAAVRDGRREAGREAIVNCGRALQANGAAAIGAELTALFDADADAGADDAILTDPAVQAWQRFLLRALGENDRRAVARHCGNLPGLLARTARRIDGAAERYVPGTRIAFQYLDLDPYIMAAAPPTYDFDAALRSGGRGGGHDADFHADLHADLVATALETIGGLWPELRREIDDAVRIVGYLPDAEFRSCSAARYHGVIFLGAIDASLLDIEESLVHECGHQILYGVAEHHPLTRPGTPMTPGYTLPWSGSRRDLFGYFHAFYIYALLVKYFWRRAAGGGHAAAAARRRAILILIGIRLAEPDLRAAANLTDQAQAMLGALVADMDRIEDDMIASDAPGPARGEKA